MKTKKIIWDYEHPPQDELWLARRLAEFFPFIAGDLTPEDKTLLLKHLDDMKLPAERKEFIKLVCKPE